MIVPEWLDEIRLEPGPPFSSMGTHALALADWLVVDGRREADLAYKRHLLDTARQVVFAAEPGSEAPATELLSVIRRWLGDRGIAAATARGDDHPLIEASRLVQEDLAVLQRIGGSWVLTAGAVCFPTHWAIGDKVGATLAGIHEPVAHYEEELRDRVDRFHDRLSPDRPVWRRNWFVVPTNELHLPERRYEPSDIASIAEDGSPMWIRSERQTLRRLPESDAIVFTIRVQQAPLGSLLQRPDLAARMLATMCSWDREKRAYTSTGRALDQSMLWLRGVVGNGA